LVGERFILNIHQNTIIIIPTLLLIETEMSTVWE